MMRNRDVITLGWITGYNDEQSANVNESKTKNPKQFIHHWGMQHNKTTRPLPRTPAKISQTSLQTPCCSTVLSDCAEKRSSFFSQLLEKTGLKYHVSQVSLMPGWWETRFTFTFSMIWGVDLFILKDWQNSSREGSANWQSLWGLRFPVIQANYSYNKSISSEFDLGNRAKGIRLLVLDHMTSVALSLYAFHSQCNKALKQTDDVLHVWHTVYAARHLRWRVGMCNAPKYNHISIYLTFETA